MAGTRSNRSKKQNDKIPGTSEFVVNLTESETDVNHNQLYSPTVRMRKQKQNLAERAVFESERATFESERAAFETSRQALIKINIDLYFEKNALVQQNQQLESQLLEAQQVCLGLKYQNDHLESVNAHQKGFIQKLLYEKNQKTSASNSNPSPERNNPLEANSSTPRPSKKRSLSEIEKKPTPTLEENIPATKKPRTEFDLDIHSQKNSPTLFSNSSLGVVLENESKQEEKKDVDASLEDWTHSLLV